MGAVAVLIIGTFIAAQWRTSKISESELATRNTAQEIAGARIDLVTVAKDIQINVIQVQQWLTDISATRALDGLNDGFDVAAEQAPAFAVTIKRAEGLAAKLNLTEMFVALKALKADFPVYYAAGKKMATGCVDDGPEMGNPMMAGFDGAAVRLNGRLDALLFI
jgi:methyl-accepting chemotaxis protein